VSFRVLFRDTVALCEGPLALLLAAKGTSNILHCREHFQDQAGAGRLAQDGRSRQRLQGFLAGVAKLPSGCRRGPSGAGTGSGMG
jgi:hypothetical protein